jgi:hypothetical protein
MLISKMSAPEISIAICAASAMQFTSLPKICAANGFSPGNGRSSCAVFVSW